jgi:hypothetical protein
MCCKDKKEFYPIIMGLCPKPRDLTLYRQKHDEARAVQEVLPHVFVTGFGARGASQQSPVLRAGINRIVKK